MHMNFKLTRILGPMTIKCGSGSSGFMRQMIWIYSFLLVDSIELKKSFVQFKCASKVKYRQTIIHIPRLRLKLRVRNRKIIFLFLNHNICCGYSKEPSQRQLF